MIYELYKYLWRKSSLLFKSSMRQKNTWSVIYVKNSLYINTVVIKWTARAHTHEHIMNKRLNVIQCTDILTVTFFFIFCLEVKRLWDYSLNEIMIFFAWYTDITVQNASLSIILNIVCINFKCHWMEERLSGVCKPHILWIFLVKLQAIDNLSWRRSHFLSFITRCSNIGNKKAINTRKLLI